MSGTLISLWNRLSLIHQCLAFHWSFQGDVGGAANLALPEKDNSFSWVGAWPAISALGCVGVAVSSTARAWGRSEKGLEHVYFNWFILKVGLSLLTLPVTPSYKSVKGP